MPMYVVLHGTAQIPVGKAQNQAQNELPKLMFKKADQMTLVEAQNRAQNELKYLCSDEEHQRRHTYVYVCCFAWDTFKTSSNRHS